MPPSSSSGFNIEVQGVPELEARLTALGNAMPLALVRAINRTRTAVLTRMLRWLVAATGVTQARIRRSIRSATASRARPAASISLFSGRAPLIQFNQAQQRTHLPPHAFRARMPRSGHVGFFERTSSAKSRRIRPGVWHTLPIREVMGPPFTDFLTGVGMADLLAYGGERLKVNLEHEIAFLESQQAAAAARPA